LGAIFTRSASQIKQSTLFKEQKTMPEIVDTYEVLPGDSLSQIAADFGISVEDLLAANQQITNRDLINVGQKINIPGTTPAPPVTPAPGHSEVYDGHHPAPGTTSTARALYSHPPLTNAPGQRDPDIYSQLINQFAVGDNPRFLAGQGQTYCNIFVWDVTRAMGAEVPHWVDAAGDIAAPGALGAFEININAGVTWMRNHGAPRHGWQSVTPAQAQDSANQGKVAVVMWKNETGAHGHTAVVRPGSVDGNGPATAQAGRHNFNLGHVRLGFGSHGPLEFFVHE
jgi:LysM repeat protein